MSEHLVLLDISKKLGSIDTQLKRLADAAERQNQIHMAVTAREAASAK
jgi:hypothetical protein